MADLTPTRRGILGVLAAAPVFAGSLAARANAGAVEQGAEAMNMHTSIVACGSIDRAGWDSTKAAYEAAKHAHADYTTRVYRPLDDELDRVAPRPDLCFEVTAENGRTVSFDVWPNRLHEWDNHISPVFREKAAAVREAWLAHLAARHRLGWNAAADEVQRLCDVECGLEGNLILTPAPDQGALLWKLDQMFGEHNREEDGECPAWCAKWMNAVMADIHRLLSREG